MGKESGLGLVNCIDSLIFMAYFSIMALGNHLYSFVSDQDRSNAKNTVLGVNSQILVMLFGERPGIAVHSS